MCIRDRTTVPLNIFEPRYIQMIDDSMKSNRMIGMIQPKKVLIYQIHYMMLDAWEKSLVLMKQKTEDILLL